MGPVIRAVFLVLPALSPLLPGLASAESQSPSAAFPDPTAKPASSASAAPDVAPPAPAPAAPSAPAPASSAPPAPASAPEPAQAPPPAPYPAPYPYPYPPPPGYPYYYPVLAPIVPVRPPPPRYDDDAAVASTPFFDAIIVAADWQNRISESASIGAQAGVYVVHRVRLTAKITFPTEGWGDQQADFESGTKNPSFFYAFSAGFAAVRTPTFAMSPGVMFARTDVSDYGTMFGFSLPLDWVTKGGLRLGLEGGLGPSFGGRRTVTCTGTSDQCSQQPRYQDRASGAALWLQFHIGFGFNHPGPLPPDVPATAGAPR